MHRVTAGSAHKSCCERLIGYADGNTDAIEELCEAMLLYHDFKIKARCLCSLKNE